VYRIAAAEYPVPRDTTRASHDPFAPHSLRPAGESPLNRHVLLYGLLGGFLIALLKAVEYRFLVVQYSVAIYGGLIAAIFAGLGIWLGLRITRPAPPPPTVVTIAAAPAATPFVRDAAQLETLRVTPRELEILELIAHGLSNREIAQKLFVSENTVKTHSTRLFGKLGARRRTQAVQLGKQRGLIA
jgi:two-component system, NarL family, response regulator LiaR